MAQTVGDYLLERLRQWDVEQVFAYPGDGINGIIAAFGRAENKPRFVQARHEEMAAFEAVGYAKFSGRVAICMATSGPGAIHLLNGLYDAKLDHVPVVAIVGQTARSAMGGSYQQEVDLQSLFKDVASEYLVEVNVASQLPNALDRAIRIAQAQRAPTAIIIPSDLQEEHYEPPAHAFKQVPSSPPSVVRSTVVPDAGEIRRAVEVINAGERVALLVGQGARGARAEVTELAEITGAGAACVTTARSINTATPVLGGGVLASDLMLSLSTTIGQNERASDLVKRNVVLQRMSPLFRLTGLKQAIADVATVLEKAFAQEPDLATVLSTEGMLSVRMRKPTDGSVSTHVSNHAWGTAVDFKVVGFDAPANTGSTVPRFIAILIPLFNDAGWFSGVGFHDTMHFEVSEERIRELSSEGVFN